MNASTNSPRCYFLFSHFADIQLFWLVVEPLVRRTNICLQVEELATIEFHWLGVGKCRRVSIRCAVVASRKITIQSNYSFVFRWNYFSRYARCKCHVYHPSRCFWTLLDSRSICWVLLRSFAFGVMRTENRVFMKHRRGEKLYHWTSPLGFLVR